ncbi:MAG: hypothetical protein GY758_11610 [Fuerstiella sp.]|nr:hypothetical protein [Fuerstiella sp.]MCP4786856.1 hypothetical protein [Fuerstiella sp.]MCP4853358.1 hypothetical protein [Fuerstiella sp.]
MQRLSYILIALALGLAPNQSHARDAFYSVVGDVSSAQSYRCPERQQVYLRDLLDNGGYNNATGYARILRGTPLKTVTTDSVNPKMTGSGTLLLPGDVVVFRSLDGYCPGRQNSLAMFGDGPVLLEIPGDGYPVRRLFELTQTPQDGRILVTRTRPGSASEVTLSQNDFIQHGDIINLAGIAQTTGRRISQVYQTAPGLAQKRGAGIQLVQYRPDAGYPTYDRSSVQGEWHRNNALQPSALSVAAAKKPTLLNRFLNTFKGRRSGKEEVNQAPVYTEQPAITAFPPPPPRVVDTGISRLPPRNHVTGIRPVAQNADGAAQSTSTFRIPPVDSNPARDSLTPNEFLSPTETGQMLLQIDNIVQTGNIASNKPFRTASRQTPSDDPASFANAQTDEHTPIASPQTPSEVPGHQVPAPTIIPGQRNVARNIAWNALFLTGLAVATGLIVFGWLKTKREQSAVHQIDGSIQDSRFAEAGDRIEHTATPVVAVPVPAVPKHNLQTLEQAVKAPTPSENVIISGDCPVLSAGIDEFDTAEKAMPAVDLPSPISESNSADDIGESHTDGTVDIADAVVQNSEPYKDKWLIQNPYNVASELSGATSGEHTTDIESAANEMHNSPREESFSDLEDLLRNRLPVDIKQADLPLRVALFGKPAGPRHLRIDAAHTQTAPPHMLTSARQKEKSKTAATTASVSQHDRADNQPAEIAAANADHDRFDHALNFLEGQSDS